MGEQRNPARYAVVFWALTAVLVAYRVLEARLEYIATTAGVLALIGVFAVVRGRPGWRRLRGDDERDVQCRAYSLRVPSNAAASSIARILSERSRRSLVNFIVAYLFGRRGHGSYLLMCGPRVLVEREVDIVEALIAAAAPEARIEPAGTVNEDVSALLPPATGRWDSRIPAYSAGGSAVTSEPVVELGVRIDTPLPEPVHLYDIDIEGHVGVFGSTGTGKSTTLRRIVRGAAAKWGRVIVVDWMGEHGLIPGAKRINAAAGEAPLDPVASLGDPIAAAEVLSSALGLTDPQTHMLVKALGAGISSVTELYRVIEEFPEEAKWDREVKRALLRKLSPVLQAPRAFSPGNHKDIFKNNYKILIFDLSGFVSVRSKRVYALTLAAIVYKMVREGALGRVLLVIDEAHNIIDSEYGLIAEISSEARKYGLSLAYATQSPSLIPIRVINNTNTKIVHALRSQQDKEYIARAMSIHDRLGLLDKLAQGEALLQAPSHPQPVLIKVKPG